MKKGTKITLGVVAVIVLIIIITISWGVGVYNKLVGLDEGVKQAWGQVENQYQRRYDLIPNLVSTVKGVANFDAKKTPFMEKLTVEYPYFFKSRTE